MGQFDLIQAHEHVGVFVCMKAGSQDVRAIVAAVAITPLCSN